MEIVGEEGTQGAVHQSGNENLVLGGTGFAFEETAGEATHSGVFLLVFNSEGHEVDVFAHFGLGTYGGQKHRVVHSDDGGTVGLFGQFAGFNFDDMGSHVNLLGDDVHFFVLLFLDFQWQVGSTVLPTFLGLVFTIYAKVHAPSAISKKVTQRTGLLNHNQINMKNYFLKFSFLMMARYLSISTFFR